MDIDIDLHTSSTTTVEVLGAKIHNVKQRLRTQTAKANTNTRSLKTLNHRCWSFRLVLVLGWVMEEQGEAVPPAYTVAWS